MTDDDLSALAQSAGLAPLQTRVALTLLSTTTSPPEELDIIEINGQFILSTNPVQLVTSVLAWPASATNYVLQSAGQL